MLEQQEAFLAAATAIGGLQNPVSRSHNQEQMDDDECGDGGLECEEDVDGGSSELERYIRDISQFKNAHRAKTAPIKAAK